MTGDIIRRRFIVRGIPEGQVLSEISLIWEMSVYESIHPVVPLGEEGFNGGGSLHDEGTLNRG